MSPLAIYLAVPLAIGTIAGFTIWLIEPKRKINSDI